jgi:hypothetical protein
MLLVSEAIIVGMMIHDVKRKNVSGLTGTRFAQMCDCDEYRYTLASSVIFIEKESMQINGGPK